MVDASQISPHMIVVGSDGQHVGTVDNLGIKLTKTDPDANGQHHYIKLDTVASVENNTVTLNVPASQAIEQEKVIEA